MLYKQLVRDKVVFLLYALQESWIMSNRMSLKVVALTPRQREVVRFVSLGCSVAEISAILGLAASTVDNHKAAAMSTLGVDKATILTRVAIKHRISTLNDQLTRSEKRKLGKSRSAQR